MKQFSLTMSNYLPNTLPIALSQSNLGRNTKIHVKIIGQLFVDGDSLRHLPGATIQYAADRHGMVWIERYELARLVETLFPHQSHMPEFRPILATWNQFMAKWNLERLEADGRVPSNITVEYVLYFMGWFASQDFSRTWVRKVIGLSLDLETMKLSRADRSITWCSCDGMHKTCLSLSLACGWDGSRPGPGSGRSGTAPFTVPHVLRNGHRKGVKHSAPILRALVAAYDSWHWQ